MDRELPRDLYGRGRTDRLMRSMAAVVNAFDRIAQLDRRRPPVTAVDRNLRLSVEQVRSEAVGVRSVSLVAPDGSALPAWHPGAHLDVALPSGRVRQYSLCGDPTDRGRYRIAVRRIGAGSEEVHESLRPGDGITVRGPRNAFPLVRSDRYLFVAGGIGITPILPMLRAAESAGSDWHIVYCGRSRDSMPFLDELAEFPAAKTWIRPDEEYGAPVAGDELLESAAGAAVYCCGPAPLITGLRLGFPASGARELHFERFSPPPIVAGTPFEVELRRSGHLLTVPAEESALEVIRRVRPDIAYSCRQGFCGTCRVSLLAGTPEHRDGALTEDERAHAFMPCVSRAEHGRLVLDL